MTTYASWVLIVTFTVVVFVVCDYCHFYDYGKSNEFELIT